MRQKSEAIMNRQKCKNCQSWMRILTRKGMCKEWEWFYQEDFKCAKFKDLKYRNQLELFTINGEREK